MTAPQTTTVLAGSLPVYHVSYDAGAGSDKAISRDANGTVVRYRGLALAGLSTWSDLGLRDQRQPPIRIELPVEVEDQGPVFPAYNTTYGVGDEMLLQDDAGYNATGSRYFDDLALIRFYAVMSRVIPVTEALVHLTVGLNANAYKDERQRTALRKIYGRRHVFKADGRLYMITVAPDVDVVPQPWAAARHIRNNPPSRLLERIARYPIEQSGVVVIDGGRYTTDVVYLAPDPQRHGKLYPKDIFAFEEAVETMYQRLAARIFQVTGQQPTLQTLEEVFVTGTLRTDTGDVDLRVEVANIKWSVWISVFTKIQMAIAKVPLRYLFVVGGIAEVLGDRLAETPISGGRTLGELPGFAVPDEPVWSVVQGYMPGEEG